MPITATHLVDNGSTTDGTVFTTASVTPAANTLLLLTVVSSKTSGGNAATPTVTGNGLTWVHVNGVDYKSGAERVDTFRAMGAAPTAGALTITYALEHMGSIWSLDQFSGVDTQGTNGSAAVLQSGIGTLGNDSGPLIINLSRFGSHNNATYGGYGRADNSPPTVGPGYTLLGDHGQSTPSSSVMSQWLATGDRTAEATNPSGIRMGGVALEIKSGSDQRSAPEKFFGTADQTVSGGQGVDAIENDPLTATDSTSIARFAAGGTVTSRRWRPGTATGPEATVPATGAAPAKQGWREVTPMDDDISPDGTAQATITAQTIPIRLRVRRSGQTLEIDQNSDITVILYGIANSVELGRATVRHTWTTTATELLFNIVIPSSVSLTQDERLLVEVYVVTLSATNAVLAPAVATDLIIQVGLATDSRIGPVAHTLRTIATTRSVSGASTVAMSRRLTAGRSFSVNGPSTAALSRRLTLARLFSVSGPSTVTSTRRLTLARSFSVNGPSTAAFARRLTLLRARSVSGSSTITTARTITAARSFSVSGTANAVFSRRLTMLRSTSVSGVATVAFSRLITYLRSYQATGEATVEFSRLLSLSRTNSVAGTSTVTTTRSLTLARFFEVLGSHTVATDLDMIFARMFSVTGTFLARTRIDMPQVVLNRIGGGGPITTVIRKFFPVSDD